mmetsp:Transcript_13553/g.51742  ORF Transcript_13553/g.51742 Transcript_13553/m.51742 type:complete len:254 (+) Transcript_13553:1638-2399(+)
MVVWQYHGRAGARDRVRDRGRCRLPRLRAGALGPALLRDHFGGHPRHRVREQPRRAPVRCRRLRGRVRELHQHRSHGGGNGGGVWGRRFAGDAVQAALLGVRRRGAGVPAAQPAGRAARARGEAGHSDGRRRQAPPCPSAELRRRVHAASVAGRRHWVLLHHQDAARHAGVQLHRRGHPTVPGPHHPVLAWLPPRVGGPGHRQRPALLPARYIHFAVHGVRQPLAGPQVLARVDGGGFAGQAAALRGDGLLPA